MYKVIVYLRLSAHFQDSQNLFSLIYLGVSVVKKPDMKPAEPAAKPVAETTPIAEKTPKPEKQAKRPPQRPVQPVAPAQPEEPAKPDRPFELEKPAEPKKPVEPESKLETPQVSDKLVKEKAGESAGYANEEGVELAMNDHEEKPKPQGKAAPKFGVGLPMGPMGGDLLAEMKKRQERSGSKVSL